MQFNLLLFRLLNNCSLNPAKHNQLNHEEVFAFTVLALIILTSNSQSLNGNYTINQNLPAGNGNYQSFSSLAADLNAFGVSGPVVVNVAPGTYQGSLYLKSIQGTSSTNTIIIDGQDSSLAILEDEVPFVSWSENAIVVLDSVQYISIQKPFYQKYGQHFRRWAAVQKYL